MTRGVCGEQALRFDIGLVPPFGLASSAVQHWIEQMRRRLDKMATGPLTHERLNP